MYVFFSLIQKAFTFTKILCCDRHLPTPASIKKKLNKKYLTDWKLDSLRQSGLRFWGLSAGKGWLAAGENKRGRRLPGHLGSRVLQQPPPPCQSSRWLNYWPGRWCAEHGQAWRPGHSVRDGGTMELGQVPTLMSVQISSENKGLFLPVGLPCI